jgi:hypothetical protein
MLLLQLRHQTGLAPTLALLVFLSILLGLDLFRGLHFLSGLHDFSGTLCGVVDRFEHFQGVLDEVENGGKDYED